MPYFVRRRRKPDAKIKPPTPQNVIAFKKNTKMLTDGDIQSLFLGLVRLVKKNAQEESEQRYKDKLEEAKNLLQKAVVRITSKERDCDKLKEEIMKLKNENTRLADLNLKLRCLQAEQARKNMNK